MEPENSDIDKYFRQKLKDYEKSPSKAVWENIQQNLDEPEKSSGNIRIRYFMAIAASVILLATVGTLFYKLSLKTSSDTIIKEVSKLDTPQKLPVPQLPGEAKSQAVSKPISETGNIASAQTTKKDELINISTTDKKTEFYLPDSSRITLNKNSKLSYNPSFAEKREVRILNGEAYFEVRKMKERFTVKGNLSITEVHGTSFMVRSYPNENKDEIYVASGKVSVAHFNSVQQKTFLLPDEKCIIKKTGLQIPEKIKEENYSAWKSEEIVFQNTELGIVVKTLEEYYGVSLQINNPEILTCRFTGRFEKSSLNEVLQVLTATFNLSFNDREGAYTLSGKGCK